MTQELRQNLLRLLDTDIEFRYAVAGYIGLGDILKELVELRKRSEQHDRKFNEIVMELRELKRDTTEIRAYIERTSITLEEEAREVIEHRLREKGTPVKLSQLSLPDLEVNIYGATDQMCVIGEVSTRTGTRIVDLLEERIDTISRRYPERLRPITIKVIYTLWATGEAVEKARAQGIWMLKATTDLTSPKHS